MRPLFALLLLITVPLLPACGDDDLYAPCDEAGDCEVPEDAAGVCLDKGGDGFCTWECTADIDCDFEEEEEAYGEDIDRVCASFEDEAGMYCFPPCEDTADSGDEEGACPAGLTCRSTGGGSENRKICFPTE